MKPYAFLILWLASCRLCFGAGSINGVAVTAWNGVVITSWNGTGISAAGGGGGPTYLVDEGFEGTGYEESWTEAGTTPPDEDYATSPAPLVGSQSLRITSTGTSNTTRDIGSGFSTMEAYFQINSTALFSAEQTLFCMMDSSNTLVAEVRMRTTGTLRIRAGSTTPQSNTTDAMSTATLYHVWVRYVKGTGADAFASVEFSTTGTRSGSGNKFISVNTGPSTTDAQKIRFGPTSTVTASDLVIDRVLVDDATIGNSP